MLKLIINNDGSVRLIDFPNYIVKGSYGELDALKIMVALADQNINDGTFTAMAEFILPDGSHQNLLLTSTESADNLQWKYGYLNAAITVFSGVLICSIRISSNVGSNVLYTYNTKITVNPSSMSPSEEEVAGITQAQYTELYDYAFQKVDKKITEGTFVYTHTGSTQGENAYGTSVTANYIVQRDSNGQVSVPTTPTDNTHATSKEYVDKKTKSYILDTNFKYIPTPENPYPENYYKRDDGTYIQTWTDFQEYIGDCEYGNALIKDETESFIDLADAFIIIETIDKEHYVLILDGQLQFPLKTGDLFFDPNNGKSTWLYHYSQYVYEFYMFN